MSARTTSAPRARRLRSKRRRALLYEAMGGIAGAVDAMRTPVEASGIGGLR